MLDEAATTRERPGEPNVAPGPGILGAFATRHREAGFFLLLGLMAVAGVYLVLLATRHGVGLGSDSAVYIAAARNWLAGYGLSWVSAGMEASPVTLHAPLYSLVLAGLQVLSIDPLAGARFVNALSFGLEVFLIGYLLKRAIGASLFSLLGSLLLLAMGELIGIHSWAMSDPLYLALSLLGIALLSCFLEWPRWFLLAAAAIAVGLACLTRYVGLALAVACSSALLLDSRAGWRGRLLNSGLLLMLSVGPMGAWFGRNLLLTGQAGGREFGWYWDMLSPAVGQGLPIALNWFLPLRLVTWLVQRPAMLWPLAAGGLLIVGLLLWREVKAGPGGALRLIVLYLVLYCGSIVFTSVFFKPGSDIDERILFPAFVCLLAILMSVLRKLWDYRNRLLRGAVVLLCVVLVRNKLVYSYWIVHNLQQDGQRYASSAWRESPTVAAVESLSPSIIYTDDIAAIYLLANRFSYSIPRRLDAVTNASLPGYPEALRRMRDRIASGEAMLVLFQPNSVPPDMAPLGDLTWGLTPIYMSADGVIYGSAAPGEVP
jgi:hypothetical protein